MNSLSSKFLLDTFRYSDGFTVPELNLNISSIVIASQTRRLNAIWTVEAVQDLQSYHGIDAESELSSILTQEIRREINNNSTGFESISLPIARRIPSTTIVNDIVSVQSMSAPRGMLFYMDHTYKRTILKTFKYGK